MQPKAPERSACAPPPPVYAAPCRSGDPDLPALTGPGSELVYALECYVFATALIIMSIWIQRLEESEEDGSQARARKIDTWTRWSLPLGAAFALGGSLLILWY